MEILYGTHNFAKVEAMEKIVRINKINAKIYTMKDIKFNEEIIENGKTFEENSEIKAYAIKKYCDKNNIKDKIIITDDAGLCVDKLNGEPGVYSARYAGENSTQEENLNKLLGNLKEYDKKQDRSCKFVCVLTAILPNGEKIVSRGECKGSVALIPGSLGGLTYEPVFIPEGFDKPMGDLNEKEYKNTHNHRDIAMKKLVEKLKNIGY